jgi:hypothetical protein
MAARNPFPGMNPWLEPFWGPVHHEYISMIGRQLAAQLPDDLYPQVETDVYVVDGGARGRLFRPDVAAFDAGRPAAAPSAGSSAVAVAEPILVRVRRRTVSLPHLAIREPVRNNRLAASVNVVEIDLLRAGSDLTDVAPDDLPAGDAAGYKACVRLAAPELSDAAEYYPMPLRERLGRVKIPLRTADADVVLDLQVPIDDIYLTGRYELQIDYGRPPDPPLPPDDAAWAAERIAAADMQR